MMILRVWRKSNRLPFLLVGALVFPGAADAGWFQKKHHAPRPTPLPIARPMPQPLPAPVSPVSLASVPIPVRPVESLPETVVHQHPVYRPPSYALPYEGYRYHRTKSRKRFFFGTPEPSPEMLQLLSVIRARAEHISRFGLPYVFGGEHPSEGGMDCSGSMQFLLADIGFKDMPRTSYDQYAWLRKHRTMNHSKSIPDHMGGRKGIKPGDLIFWGGTYRSGHKVSHVMIYLGQGGDGTHYMFGARGKSKRGLNGNGVDIFRLESGYQKGLVGFGTLPGVS